MMDLKQRLLEEIPSFRELGHKFVDKEINALEFKKISGGMGVYAHRGGEKFMIRLRIPSGILSINQLKFIYEIAKEYNLESIHTTTRQAIQLHGLNIDEICEIMKKAMDYDIYTRGGGGNYPRNVSISPLSGVEVGEIFDVSPYALSVNKHFMSKITTYNLPRKLKVSFSNSDNDTGNAQIADLGFIATKKDNKDYFKVYITGGLGKNPLVAVEYKELIEGKDILYHVEAMTNLFMAEGDYSNKNKARTRYIQERMGKDDVLKCYQKHLDEVKAKENLDLIINEKECAKEGISTDFTHKRMIEQKQKGLYSIYFHPIGGILDLNTLKSLIEKLESIEAVEIRLTMDEGFYIRNLNGNEAREVIELTENIGGETLLGQSTSCIGVPTCQIGIANSQELLREIIDYFKEKNFTKDILPSVRISGCTNSCATHQIGIFGFAGKKKRVDGDIKEAFEVHIEGRHGKNGAVLGKVVGDMIREDIPKFLYEIALEIDKSKTTYDEFIKNNSDKLDEILNKYLV